MYETIGSTRLMMYNKPTHEKENCAIQQSIYYTLFETKVVEELLNYGDNKITREVHIRSKAKKKQINLLFVTMQQVQIYQIIHRTEVYQ